MSKKSVMEILVFGVYDEVLDILCQLCIGIGRYTESKF
jgi:hypothetical protein